VVMVVEGLIVVAVVVVVVVVVVVRFLYKYNDFDWCVKERSLQSRIVELESQLSQTRGEVCRQKREKAEVKSTIIMSFINAMKAKLT